MKKIIYLILTTICIPTLAFSQSSKQDIDVIQATYGKDKKEVVRSYMVIPETQKEGFWKLYDEYESERMLYGKKRYHLIEEYAMSYDSLNDQRSTELMKKKNDLQIEYAALQMKHYQKISKLIGGKQAAKFFQLEDYLENIIRIKIQESIPFIDELDKTTIIK